MSNLENRIERLMDAVAPAQGPLVYILDLRALERLGTDPEALTPAQRAATREGLTAVRQKVRRLVKQGRAGSFMFVALGDDRPALPAPTRAIGDGDG